MRSGSSVVSVREYLAETIGQMDKGSPEPLGEVLLHRNGFYVGRRFEFAEVRAIWFEEEGQVKLYDREGRFLRSLKLTNETLRSAA